MASRPGGLAWIEALCHVAHHAPWLAPLIRPLCIEVTWHAVRPMRRAVAANLRRALGPEISAGELRSRGRALYRHFYDFVVETARPARPPERMAASIERVDGLEHFTKARASGRGVILATAHLGAFETAVAGLREVEDRLHVVFKRDQIPAFERRRAEQRRRLGVSEAPIDDGLSAWVRLRNALCAGETVLMQVDRAMPGQRSVPVRLLNGHMRLPLGVVRLARLCDAPIVPVFAIRTGRGRTRVEFHPAIAASDHDGEPGERSALERLACVLGDVIGRHPEQWLVLQPAWIEDQGRRGEGGAHD